MIKRPSFCFSFVIDTLYCQTYPLASCTSAISKPLPQLQRVPFGHLYPTTDHHSFMSTEMLILFLYIRGQCHHC